MSNLISPTDPVALMLKDVVSQYQQELDSLTASLDTAFKMITEGNAVAIAGIRAQLAHLNDRVLLLELEEGKEKPAFRNTEGVEL